LAKANAAVARSISSRLDAIAEKWREESTVMKGRANDLMRRIERQEQINSWLRGNGERPDVFN
jgi:hypothetical protein